jgi:hypothetical protein
MELDFREKTSRLAIAIAPQISTELLAAGSAGGCRKPSGNVHGGEKAGGRTRLHTLGTA